MPKVVKIPGRKKPWRVILPPVNGSRRKVRFFKSREDASAFADTVEGARDDSFADLMRLSQSDRVRLLRALDTAGSIEALERAADLAAKSRVATAKPLADAIREFLATKDGKRSWQYVENLTVALRQFSAGREAVAVSSVTSAEVSTWLDGRGWSGNTRLTYVRRLETFWSWAINQGYATNDPTAGYERPDDTSGPIAVMPVDECRRLLETCRRVDPGLLPYFAICLFAGIRPDEVKRLRRENIKGLGQVQNGFVLNTGQGLIEVEALKAKTRRRRLVEIHPTLKAWLNVPGGEIGWKNWRRRWREVRNGTAVTEYGPAVPIRWASDILRHSFASYSYPIKGAAWTSNECGHSESVLFSKYRALVTVEAAREFWGIMPGP